MKIYRIPVALTVKFDIDAIYLRSIDSSPDADLPEMMRN